MENNQPSVPSQKFSTIEKNITSKQTRDGVFRQTKLLDVSKIEEYLHSKSKNEIIKSFSEDIDRFIQEVEIERSVYTTITLLMMLEKNEEEIIRLGKEYFTSHITQSIGVIQFILRNIEVAQVNLSSRTDDNTLALRRIRLSKEICSSLINEFGT